MFLVFDDCTLTLRMYVSINKDVGITFHIFLTSVLAQSKDEVRLVTNKHTEAIKPQCSTKELSAS